MNIGLDILKYNSDRTKWQSVFNALGQEIHSSCVIEQSSDTFQYAVDEETFFNIVTVDKFDGKISMVEIKPKAFKVLKKFLKS